MSFERTKQETRLTALESEVTGERLRVERFRDALRDLLDPVPSVEDLKRDNIVSLALNFGDAHISLSEKLATIKKLKEILGR